MRPESPRSVVATHLVLEAGRWAVSRLPGRGALVMRRGPRGVAAFVGTQHVAMIRGRWKQGAMLEVFGFEWSSEGGDYRNHVFHPTGYRAERALRRLMRDCWARYD